MFSPISLSDAKPSSSVVHEDAVLDECGIIESNAATKEVSCSVDNVEDLHPSWIAKKREKEALKRMLMSAKPNRIVFEDE
ncbi:unnamed protein product [Gongylonema pulchrum]|uniref:Ovule protein n=1 Tax=Gongylonema pulchrum TaxID=637853 RepID=A0A183DYE2_9BILA|nr:unnamed protein product [Gongylonema pulchrum]